MDELLKLIGDGADLSAITAKANEIKTQFDALNDANKDLTAKFEEAKQGRDKSKNNFREFEKLVKDSLGLDEITAEAISEKLKSGDGDIDAMKAKFTEDLKTKNALLEKVQAEKQELEKTHQQTMDNYMIDTEAQRAISSLENLKSNPLLIDAFKSQLVKDIKLEGGRVIPMEYHNDQLIPMTQDTKQLTLADKALLLSQDENFADFFNSSTKHGDGGAGAGGSYNGVMNRSKMTAQQKTEYRQEHGDKAFLTLPK